jgi:hypothetical protein
MVVPICTHPWQPEDRDRPKRKAVWLPSGTYEAFPTRSDHDGRPSADGQRHFAVRNRDGSPPIPGVDIGLYPEPLMTPHIGCQVLRPSDWTAFVRAVGGLDATFRYVLVDMTDHK